VDVLYRLLNILLFFKPNLFKNKLFISNVIFSFGFLFLMFCYTLRFKRNYKNINHNKKTRW